MENLEQLYCQFTKVNLNNPNDQIIFDYADGLICAIHNNNLMIYEEEKPNASYFVYTINTTDILRYVKYIPFYNIVFLATETELMLYDTQKENIEFSLNVNPIDELSWNPLETLFVVIHKNLDISSYICTKTYIELKDNSNLNAEVPIPVLSGWGSISTQFQGPRKIKKDDSVVNVVNQVPDTPPKVSWRGNGELFVVNYFQNNQRFLKVFSSDLIALDQSEPYPNLQESVAFMGQGQCIACCAIQNEDETQLVIFEKNCKVKSEFVMKDIKGSVKNLSYHPHMNILAIFYVNDQGDSFINIYLFSNGRWFFKQQLHYPPECRVHNFQWLNLNENVFTTCKMVVFTSQNIEYFYFRFIINRCPNTATVAVVNGRTIDFSLFDRKIVPPPMCYYSFEHENPINRILFHPMKHVCILIDSHHHVRILSLKDETVEDVVYLNDSTFSIGTVNFLFANFKENDVELVFQNEENTKQITRESTYLSVTLKTSKFIPHILLPYSDTRLMLPPKILDTNNYMYLTRHVVEENGIKVEYEFALSGNREFFVKDVPVCLGVTSFYIFRDYLIFTHSNSKLYCIRLRDHLLYTNEINLKKVFSRDIEQGGVIVACTNLTSPQIILQLPRGNIETIGCKLITIDVIEEKLKENKWSEVLHILRVEKVNWNVIIDLNPERFRDHIPDFVRAAKNNAVLSNVVTEFSLNENCFETFYKNYTPIGTPTLSCSKKSIIQDILLYLVSTDCVQNLLSIVAIQQKHISLKSALKSIKDVFNANKEGNRSVCSKVLKQVLQTEHFKDVENAAYNLYDLDFLSLVYRNSMEDPKIYEPEIRAYRNMGILERKFKMSCKGRNLAAAVKYLLRMTVVDDALVRNFIVKSHLEEVAYFSLEEYHERFPLVTVLYSNILSTLKKYAEAGTILKKAKLYEAALIEYTKGLEWREVTSLCSQLKYETVAKVKLYEELAADLIKANKVDDAVTLLETYMNNYKAAIDVLIEKNIYRRAICLAETYGEYDLVESRIVPKLVEYISTLLEKIQLLSAQFNEYADRLDDVRKERLEKLQRMPLGAYDDQDDLYSETSSSFKSFASKGTSKSRGTTLSSRNRRKEERKKIDLRRGGFYEDIALIRSLHILYGEVFKFGEEVREICLAGYQHNLPLVKHLHGELCELQDSMIERITKIWPEVFLKEVESTDFEIIAIIQNKQDLAPEYRSPPHGLNKSWRLELFS